MVHKRKVVSEKTKNKLAFATINYQKDNLLRPEALINLKAKTITCVGVLVFVLNSKIKELKKFTTQTKAS